MKKIVRILDSLLGQHDRIYTNNNVTYKCLNEKCSSVKKGKFKLNINIEDGTYHCWSCDLSGKPKIREDKVACFIRLFAKFDKEAEARRAFAAYIDENFENIDSGIELVIPQGYNLIFNYLHHPLYQQVRMYLLSRSLTDHDIQAYCLMYNVREQKLLFPSYDSDLTLNYFVTRTIGDDGIYENCKKDKAEIIFNEHLIDWNSDLFIVEGVIDAIASRRNSVPILGSTLSNSSTKLLQRIVSSRPRVILALDPDATNKTMKIASFLFSKLIDVYYLDWMQETRDIDEIDPSDFDNICDNQIVKFSSEQMILHRLKGA